MVTATATKTKTTSKKSATLHVTTGGTVRARKPTATAPKTAILHTQPATIRAKRPGIPAGAKEVTVDQFVAEFAGKGTRFATIFTRTCPPLNKKHRLTGEPCPYPQGVERTAVRAVQFGAVYENSVNNQRDREDHGEHFTADGLWVSKEYPLGAGERIDAFRVQHKGSGKQYFAIKPASDESGHAVVQEDFWVDLATGKTIDKETVDSVLAHYLPPVATDSGRQEVEKMIPWRCFAVESVIAVRCGDLYVLRHPSKKS